MKTFTHAEKLALATKIGEQQQDTQRKEQRLLRMKNSRRRSPIGLSNWISSSMLGSARGYRKQLRQAKQEQASQHIVDSQRVLKPMTLSAEQKRLLCECLEQAAAE